MDSQLIDAIPRSWDSDAASEPRTASAGAIGAKKGLKILMIEDDEADAYLIKRALRKNPRVGEIVHVRDGVEAVELIDHEAFRPDLALVDLKMPRKDGFSLLRDLGVHANADFPAVVLSSSRAGADRVRARIRGAVQFVTKPLGMTDMTRALDQVIARI